MGNERVKESVLFDVIHLKEITGDISYMYDSHDWMNSTNS